MTTAVRERELTVDDLLAMEDEGVGYELVDGQLVERNLSMESSSAGMEFGHKLLTHVTPRRLGRVYGSDATYRIFGSRRTGLRPDVSFIAMERAPKTRVSDVAPDLVVEVVSPGDTAYEVCAKAAKWLAAGVRMVWVAWPETLEVQVFQPNASPRMLSADDEISGEDVIPGFTSAVRDLFPAS